MAAEELIRNGCRHVLHFRGAKEVKSPYHDRHYEFERMMDQHGVKTYSYEMEWNRFDYEYYRKTVADIFSRGIEFDGVFGVDQLAICCLNEALKRGKRVPEDVKIVAYDGTFVTEMVEPRLTAVVQPVAELAHESVRLISNLINGMTYRNKQVLLEAKLERGKTTV